MSARSTRLDFAYYKGLCPNELIKDYPVPQNESESYWKPKLKNYGSVIKKSSWGPVKVFNIICQHPDCKGTNGWLNRVCAFKWKQTHHEKKHSKLDPVSVKVLSYWTHESTETG
eukprot:319840_1